MKRFNYFFWGLAYAILFIIVFFMVLHLMETGTSAVSVIISVLILVLIVSVIIFAYFSIPSVLIITGNYDKALNMLKIMYDSYHANEKLRNVLLYNMATCCQRMGKFDECIGYLEEINTHMLDKNLKWSYNAIYSAAILLSGRDTMTAYEYLKKAMEINNITEMLPLTAYAEVCINNFDKAFSYINDYLYADNRRRLIFSFLNSMLMFDSFSHDVENNYLIGLTFLSMGNAISARWYLKKCTKCRYDNYYSAKSKMFLQEL